MILDIGLRIFFALLCIGFLAFVLSMVRRERFLLRYSFFWLALGCLGLLVDAFPEPASALAHYLGFETLANFLFVVGIVVLAAACFMLCSVVSKQARRIVHLTQEISFVKAEVEHAGGSHEDAAPDRGTSR